ncbi:prepilin peptidase [Peribacillus deserti]|uniref:Prepilin peptidase n=1 Tax=Peribacillus deserti TaxID=673318 RepID=A0A2N5M723_9BACI|nr:A24 family peptidase [Peribacillus deserti]PLT30151.1 prepilin peptidase [Peribacillus deserti]
MYNQFIITFIILFTFGLILGSFYNVVGLRVPIKKSIIYPRSACPNCKHQLRPIELIPVLSYLLQGGKCRSCKSRISPLYPIMEFMTGVLFAFSPLIFGWTSELFVAWTLISLFVIIFITDVTYMIIPDKILLFFAVIFLFERTLVPLYPWWDSILGAAAGFLTLLAIAIVSKGGMGGGDIKLFGVIGFVVGTKMVLLSFFLSTFLGAVLGLAGMKLGYVSKGKPIPFGPFIVFGTLTAYFFGQDILAWYVRLLH